MRSMHGGSGGEVRMARVRLKGVNKVTTRLADGRLVTYWYAWKGGPRLVGHPGSPEFVQSYEAAHRQRRKPDAKTFHAIISGYKQSRDFTDLAPRTQRDYLKHIAHIEKAFADLPIAALGDARITSDFIKWRDGLSLGDRQQDYAWTILMRLVSWARDRGQTSYRPPSRVRKLYKSDRAEKIWLPADIAAFRAAASEQLWQALVLALETGQRQGDLIRLPCSSYDGQWIKLKQSKTGMNVAIPVSRDLRLTIESLPTNSPIMLTSSQCRPWTSDGLRTSWYKAAKRAGVDGLTFHDLRGTAVTRLAEAGCTEAEIAAITGHSLKTVGARTKGLALAAIAKLEKSRS
jgi:integrase